MVPGHRGLFATLPSARDRARRGWWLLIGAAVVSASGAVFAHATGSARADPTVEDIPFAVSGLLAVVGVLSLIGGRARGRRLDSVVEALLVTAPIAYVATPFVLDARPPGVSVTEAMIAVAAVAADVVLVVLSAELVRLRPHRRGTAAVFVLAAACCTLAVHVALTGVLFSGQAASPGADLITAVFSVVPAVLWIWAALHEDTRVHVDPAETVPTALTRFRVATVLFAVVSGPVVLAARARMGRDDGTAALAAGAVLVAGIAVAYLLRLVEQRARVEYLALHDDLCRIPNRVLLADRIAAALAQAPRDGHRVALLFLDLDRFKTINDSLGHGAGNELLRAVAARLGQNVRSGDTIARLGGDEFAVLLPTVTDAAAPAAVARKVVEAFAAPFDVCGRQLFVSASIGVSVFPDDASDAEQLLQNADAAMYRSKQGGRNTFEPYTLEMNIRANQRLTMESHLHKAIERGELVMHYQPKVALRTGRIVGMEALMRWQHPELGLLPPGEFIPLAEETGLIVALGEWALQEACAQTKTWIDAGHSQLTVAVNLSARQFQHQHVEDMVARVLRSTELDPRALELELTESLVLQDPDAVIATLGDLRNMGVRCSIDDFGTGYSGLQYLTRFPIDKLKIDKFFISEIGGGGDNARIVAAVIALAHGLRLDVIAEGVENDEQLRFLVDNECDEMQGFLFSEAIAAADFERLLVPGQHFGGRAVQRRLRLVADAAPRELAN